MALFYRNDPRGLDKCRLSASVGASYIWVFSQIKSMHLSEFRHQFDENDHFFINVLFIHALENITRSIVVVISVTPQI